MKPSISFFRLLLLLITGFLPLSLIACGSAFDPIVRPSPAVPSLPTEPDTTVVPSLAPTSSHGLMATSSPASPTVPLSPENSTTTSQTGSVAIITDREGSVSRVDTHFLLFDNEVRLTNGIPLAMGQLIPFSRMKTVELQAKYPYTLTITLSNSTIVSGVPEGYGANFIGLTTADIPLSVGVDKIQRIDFEPLTESPKYSMATITPVSGEPFEAPARSIQFGEFLRGMGAGMYWYDFLKLNNGLSVPFVKTKSLEVLRVETIPDEATSVTRLETTIAVTLTDGTVRTEVVNAYAPSIRCATMIGPFDGSINGVKKIEFEWRTDPAISWDARSRYIASGWSSDNIQKGSAAGATVTDTGEHFKITYDPKKDAYFQLFWQYPADNWNCKPKSDPTYRPGMNLKGAKAIWVTAWGETGGENVSFGAGQDCASFATAPVTVTLTTAPTKYLVATVGNDDDLSDVASVFHFAVDAKRNPSSITFFIREILVEGISQPDPRLQACGVADPTVKPLPKKDFDGNLKVLERKLSTLAWTSSDCNKANLQRLYNEGYRGVVTYGTGPEDNTALVAREIGFEGVILGIWDPASTAEIAHAAKMADYVDGYVVGNEILLRKRQQLDKQSLSPNDKNLQLRETLNQVRSTIDQLRGATAKPATTTEVVNDSWVNDIIEVGDWYFPNAHAYYNCIWEPKAAVDWTVQAYKDAVAAAQGKLVSFKEVGLPPSDLGPWPCGSQASPLTAASPQQYYELLDQAHCQGQVNFVHFFFTPLDYKPRLC